MSERRLPADFADLEPLAAADWCLATETERQKKRHESRPEILRDFYQRVSPRLEAVIEYLNTRELASLDGPDLALMHLLLAMTEVSFAVEKFGGDESSYRGIAADRFVAAHDLEDGGLPLPLAYRSAS